MYSFHAKCYKCEKEICIECPENRQPICPVDKKCRFSHTFSMHGVWCYTDHVYCADCVIEEEKCHVLCEEIHENTNTSKPHCQRRCWQIIQSSSKR